MSSTKTAHAFQVCVFDNYAETVAKRFANCCEGLIHQRGRAQVALTGGNTAKEFYKALVRPEIRGQFDVNAVEFYQGDERSVGPDHPDSNWGAAEALFLNPAGVPQTNRFRMAGEAADLDAAAREYETLLRSRLRPQRHVPAFDLLLLGMGDDGHTASLFPGTHALHETQRLVVPNDVPQLRTTRLTITYPVINAARAVWILIAGAQKADMVYRALEKRDPDLPIVGVVPKCGPLVWLLDGPAAGKLSRRIINME